MYILGIDGGGTKTKAMMLHREKGVIWETEEEATNPHSTSYAHSVEVIHRIIEKAYTDLFIPEKADVFVGMGVAGLGRKADQNKWIQHFQKRSPYSKVIKDLVVENDGKIALYSETYGKDGIVAICGTGSITIGINQSKLFRVGGWGHLVDDDPGSGFDIGSQALTAVFNQFDGLGPKTVMTEEILKNIAIDYVEALIPIIYQNFEKKHVADFSKYVFSAAGYGDDVAQQIIRRTARKIVERGYLVYQRLFLERKENTPFILAGGVFQNQLMVEEVVRGLADIPALHVIKAQNEPVLGSMIMVLKTQGYSAEQIEYILTKR